MQTIDLTWDPDAGMLHIEQDPGESHPRFDDAIVSWVNAFQTPFRQLHGHAMLVSEFPEPLRALAERGSLSSRGSDPDQALASVSVDRPEQRWFLRAVRAQRGRASRRMLRRQRAPAVVSVPWVCGDGLDRAC